MKHLIQTKAHLAYMFYVSFMKIKYFHINIIINEMRHCLPLFGSCTDADVSSASSPIKTIIHIIISECNTGSQKTMQNGAETISTQRLTITSLKQMHKNCCPRIRRDWGGWIYALSSGCERPLRSAPGLICVYLKLSPKVCAEINVYTIISIANFKSRLQNNLMNN